MKEDCDYLYWLYRFWLRRKTLLGWQSEFNEIDRHFREGRNGKPCPDPKNPYS